MSSSASSWPALTGVDATAPGNNNANLKNVNSNTQALLAHLKRNPGHKVPAQILTYMKMVETATGSAIQTPDASDARWAAMEATLAGISQNMADIQKRLDGQSARHALPGKLGPASFARALQDAGAAPPAHYLSSHESSSSAGVSPPELRNDKEVTVRLNDPKVVDHWRRETTVSMTKRVESYRVKEARNVKSAPLASVRFVAAKQLASGDLRFHLRTAREVEIVRTHPEWVKFISKKAELLMPTWGIVVHDMNVRSLGVNSPRQAELREKQDVIIDQLLSNNRHLWGDSAQISRISWLLSPKGKTGALVIEFVSPETANIAIEQGVLWDCESKSAVKYDRAIRVRQCRQYQK